jgi:hypothetical protein
LLNDGVQLPIGAIEIARDRGELGQLPAGGRVGRRFLHDFQSGGDRARQVAGLVVFGRCHGVGFPEVERAVCVEPRDLS